MTKQAISQIKNLTIIAKKKTDNQKLATNKKSFYHRKKKYYTHNYCLKTL